MPPDISELKRYFAYDAETGLFTWNAQRTGRGIRHKIGAIAGSIDGKGYWRLHLNDFEMRAHRVAWAFVYGRWPEKQIDHINGDKLDNRIVNLREATSTQNHFNRDEQTNNTSGIKGVYWHHPTGKWRAALGMAGKQIHLGVFPSKEAAARAYRDAAHLLCEGFNRVQAV